MSTIIKVTYQTRRPCLTTAPFTEKRVESLMGKGVFLTKFEIFETVVEHFVEYLIYLLNQN